MSFTPKLLLLFWVSLPAFGHLYGELNQQVFLTNVSTEIKRTVAHNVLPYYFSPNSTMTPIFHEDVTTTKAEDTTIINEDRSTSISDYST